MATREANLIGHLSPDKGNMWRLIYETSHKAIQTYWKYAPGSSTAMARERAAAMNPRQPTGKGTSQGRGWGTIVPGKLPPDFNPVSSTAYFGDMSIEDRKNKIFHQSLYNTAWSTLQGILTSLGTSEDNLPAFECTFIHWFRFMESNPMNVPIEALLQPLYEEEKKAYFADLPQDTPEDVVALHKEIIIDSLTNVKNFMSSFGVVVKDFFDPDKSRFSLHPIKGGKGGKNESFPALGGKSTGKSASTRRPKEPTPFVETGRISTFEQVCRGIPVCSTGPT